VNKLKIRHISTGIMVATGYMSREEALFYLSLAITVLQLIYDFYSAYTERKAHNEAVDQAKKAHDEPTTTAVKDST